MCCFKHTRCLNKCGRASRNESYRKEWRYHSQSLGCLDKRISLGSSKRQRKVIPCDKLEMSEHGFLSPSVDVCVVEFIDVATSRDILSCKSEDVLLHLFMKTTAKCEKHSVILECRKTAAYFKAIFANICIMRLQVFLQVFVSRLAAEVSSHAWCFKLTLITNGFIYPPYFHITSHHICHNLPSTPEADKSCHEVT